MLTRTIDGPAGPFLIPAEPEVRTQCSEICCRHVFEGEYNYGRPSVEPVRTIVDVGANVGSFAVWASRVWWPGQIIRIDCYEPNASAISLIVQNTLVAGHQAWVHPVAVTSRRSALFKEHDDWGGSRTCGETSGVPVKVLHPRDLPPADCLKVDAEGVDPEVFYHYRHMQTVLVAMWEYHDARDREPIEWICRENGLTQVRHHGSPPKQGIQIWVRR
jgi:FkbM family methyltransferase